MFIISLIYPLLTAMEPLTINDAIDGISEGALITESIILALFDLDIVVESIHIYTDFDRSFK